MTDSKKRWLLVALGAVIAVALMVAAVWAVRQAQRGAGTHAGLITDEQLVQFLNSNEVIAAGAVQDSGGRVVEGATVTLSLHNGNGQVVWRLVRPVQADGSFKIQIQDLPSLPNIYAGTLAAEAPNYLAEKADVSVEISSSPLAEQGAPAAASVTPNPTRPTQISPRRIRLKLVSYSPWLTLIVLTPAVLGLLLAIMHLNQFTRGIWVTYAYSLGVAFLWALVVGALGWLYLTGNSLIPLFWPDLFVSSGIVIFAFIGNVIYVAYAIAEERHSFFDASETKRRGLLLRLGGRIIVAPYIALVAYGIFAATFPTLRTGPFAAFFGFFTGLWIKPILEALNDIGLRLLSVEERQKVAAEATRAENPNASPPQRSSALALRPEQAFLDAVNAAREELLKKKNVIGVAPGFKETGDEVTGQRAIITYVYEKEEPESKADRVPETFMGFLTDVVPLPQADRSQDCRDVAFSMSFEKLNADNEERLKQQRPNPNDAPIDRSGQVLALADPSLFFRVTSDHFEFDAKRAYGIVQPVIGDKFDFIAFIIDPKMGDPFFQGNFNIPIFNNVSGTNHYNGSSFSVRQDWGTEKLLACQVISPLPLPLSFRTFIHELAHSWCAYVTFNDPDASGNNPSFDLLFGKSEGDPRYHWNSNLLSQRSCMTKEQFEWLDNADGTFTKSPLNDEDFGYSDLDLYLIGLPGPNPVDPLKILKSPTAAGPRDVFSASIKTVTIEQIIASCGKRIPSVGSKRYRQALVVISNTPANALNLAQGTDREFRTKYEDLFRRATRNRATLSTSLT